MPQPATIIINTITGKIAEILPSYQARDTNVQVEDGIIWIDAGDRVVLPGLVEYVVPSTMQVG